MKYKRINKWLNALESGKYKQTKSKLYNNNTNGFCCLGVLTNEYCETKNLDFDDITGYKKAFDYKLEELESMTWYDIPQREKEREAKRDAEHTYETTSLNILVSRWIGLRNNVSLKDLKWDAKLEKKYYDQSYTDTDHRGTTDILATLNDGGVKFKDIAKFIRDNRKVLFK